MAPAGLFCFLPNPNLRPEVGKNKEVGLNLKFDSIFFSGRHFRGKFNVLPQQSRGLYRTRGYPRPQPFAGLRICSRQFYQYQNIQAHIQGFEAEMAYDAGDWFVGVDGNLLRGKNTVTNIGLDKPSFHAR